jgi:hypothetical protein
MSKWQASENEYTLLVLCTGLAGFNVSLGPAAIEPSETEVPPPVAADPGPCSLHQKCLS